MKVIRFYRGTDRCKVERAISLVFDGLWLNACQHGAATPLFKISVGLAASDIFLAPLTVRQNGKQVALGAAGDEKGIIIKAMGIGVKLRFLKINLLMHLW